MSDHSALLIGCGSRAGTHARALSASDRFELAAVCDLIEEKARSTAEEHGVPAVHTDFEEAIAAEAPTHVSVVTQPTVRLPLVTDVLDLAPPSVLIEKPVANTLDGVRRIADVAAAVDTRVTVCHQKPWAEEVAAVKEWIDGGRLGNVDRLVATTKLGIASQGTHFVHTLNWLLGEHPTRVSGWASGPATLDPGASGHSEPGDTVYELRYGDTTSAFLHQGDDAPDVPAGDSYSLQYRLDVVGEDGRAEFVLGSHAKGVFADGVETVEARPFDEDAYMTRALYDRLGVTLSGGADSHPSDLDSAVAAHRALDAAMRSAIEGRAIDPRENPPAVGTTTNERLQRRLRARSPVVVSSLLFGDRPRTAALDALADLGVHGVDLWGTEMFVDHHFDPRAETVEDVRGDLEARAMDVSLVSVFDDEPVAEKLRFAADLGAETAVMAGRTPERPETYDPEELQEWLDVAAEVGVTLAFENHVDTLETVDEMEALLDALDHPAAGICLAPPHLHVCGERPEEALVRLGEDIEVLYLWDMEPGVTRETVGDVWYGRADSQVPGGGGAVDFGSMLETAIEHAPDAEWVLCYHGTEEWEEERIRESVARSLRYVEARRP